MQRPTTAVRYAILGVGIVYTAVLYASGVHLDNGFKYAIALLPAVGAIVLMIWDAWAWRQPLLARLTHRPRIDGLWEVELTPTEESHIPPGGDRGPIPGFLVVTQSYWSIHVRQFTAESTSRSRAFFWESAAGADAEPLRFVYENLPNQRLEDRSNRHLGACSLDIASRAPQTISGVYFTDRYTKGDMRLTLVDRTTGYGSYEEARSYASGASG